jgi:peptide-methionine (S)-S-oxide reductase
LGCALTRRSRPELRFSQLAGVVHTRVGYTGGSTERPTYGSVCGNDGHTEALRVSFDPSIISYAALLRHFFEEHNPQRKSHKAQYKSAVWWHSDAQEETLRAAVAELEALHGSVATTLAPAQAWWDAEEHHQKYMEKQGWKRKLRDGA